MSTKVHLSPGTYVTEKDLTFTVEALGVTTLGLVGETVKGPAFQPLFVKNYDVFKTLFGGTNPEKFRNTQIPKYELPYIAKSYLTQSNQLFVTRVLGLSGYNKGMAYVVKTIGALDIANVTADLLQGIDFPFTYDTTNPTAVPMFFDNGSSIITLSNTISNSIGIDFNKFDLAFAAYFSKTNFLTKDWAIGNILKWGEVPSNIRTTILAEAILNTGNQAPVFINAYELPAGNSNVDESEYFLMNELQFDEGSSEYSGNSFALYCDDIVNNSGVVSGTVKLKVIELSALPIYEYHNKLVTTLRSRASYVSDELIEKALTLEISDANKIGDDPYSTFELSGTTSTGVFFHTVSLDPKKKSFIKNVLGVSAFDKSTNIYVEDVYSSVLAKGIAENKIKGLYSTLIGTNKWGHYKFQYQSPTTPYFVSELRGGNVERLFRAITISDGSNANTEIKLSIVNIDLGKKTFDVQVRSFYDSDKNVSILERYINCTMNEQDDNYIGKKIGTIDNKYDLKSSYIILEMADAAPSDALPCGFEGYEFRTLIDDDVETPEIFYKTKYYKAGDVIVNPLIGSPIISAGDKVKKAYLGFTDTEFGFDADLLSFKGKVSIDGSNDYNQGEDYATKTKGFHLDVNAPEYVFTVGDDTFDDATVIASDSNHQYFDIRTRKFTCLFAGGFDGWDEFRESRTNTDTYKVGRAGFTNGTFDVFQSVEYDETFGSSDYYAYLYGIKTFENPESTLINILATPGIDIETNKDLVKDVVEMMEDKRKDSIYIPTIPDIKMLNNASAANTDNYYFPKDAVDILGTADIDSSYAALYYPWIQVIDTENKANIFIPPTGEVVRNMAYTDNIAHPWYAVAGYNRGIVNTKKARIQLDVEKRDTLYAGRINPLVTFSDVGVVIFGNKNLLDKNSPLNRVNVRRLLLQAQKLIVNVGNKLLFDPNDTQLRNSFISQVNPILDNIRKERGLSDFRVILSDENAEGVDRNTIIGKIYVKPMDSLEFLELEFNVAEDSVNFGTA